MGCWSHRSAVDEEGVSQIPVDAPPDPAALPHVEALLAAPDAAMRARALLEAAAAPGSAAAVAVWRRLEEPFAWRPLLERGPAGALPPSAAVRGVLAGEAAWTLPCGARVVRCDASSWALVLGEAYGARADELDRLEALLLVAEALETRAASAACNAPGLADEATAVSGEPAADEPPSVSGESFRRHVPPLPPA